MRTDFAKKYETQLDLTGQVSRMILSKDDKEAFSFEIGYWYEKPREVITLLLASAEHSVVIHSKELGLHLYEDPETSLAVETAYKNNPNLDFTVIVDAIHGSYSNFLTTLLKHTENGLRFARDVEERWRVINGSKPLPKAFIIIDNYFAIMMDTYDRMTFFHSGNSRFAQVVKDYNDLVNTIKNTKI